MKIRKERTTRTRTSEKVARIGRKGKTRIGREIF